MASLDFTKMHGLGNDFIIIDGIGKKISSRPWSKLTVQLCDRFTGVGGDGVILALPSRRADARMRIFNSDGSESEMCGNGLRCMIRLIYDRGYLKTRQCSIETMKRNIAAQIVFASKKNFLVRYCVGEPEFVADRIPMNVNQEYFINGKIKINRKNYVVTSLSVGNPHTVVFVDDLSFDWRTIGAEIEVHPMFPNRTNVEFAMPATKSRILLKSWERGAGPTHASGTGACAAVAAGVLVGLLKREVEVVCDLGSLIVEWPQSDGSIYQTGSADYSFTGIA
ncbi:MAG: diaminopimelate epimerase [candidate division Zixibacteria bacterium]|nr:diaminopimelate epimerase [candidate division Zixibacteria bacterium]MBU1470565.1 diaminopimelate epimerase [candidate division Zixibacteria bacterium]MBU2624461.1 diaminopimelate epimerase [candidate division Zixibacteria bacterium]